MARGFYSVRAENLKRLTRQKTGAIVSKVKLFGSSTERGALAYDIRRLKHVVAGPEGVQGRQR